MGKRELLECLLQDLLQVVADEIPEPGWGLKTQAICKASGLPWPVVTGLMAQLKVEGFVHSDVAFDDETKIAEMCWFLTPKGEAETG